MSEQLDIETEAKRLAALAKEPHTCRRAGADCEGSACISHDGGKTWWCLRHNPDREATEQSIGEMAKKAGISL